MKKKKKKKFKRRIPLELSLVLRKKHSVKESKKTYDRKNQKKEKFSKEELSDV